MTATRLDNTRVIARAARPEAYGQELADRGAAAHADEQPRSRGRRAPGRAGGLRRHRPRGARLGTLRQDRRDLDGDSRPTRRCCVQSGKPVGVFQTHADAPRVLIANSNLVPHWATWDHFNELDRKGLMMYGQMTAGVVDLHRHAGHRPGHLRDLRRDRAAAITAATSPAAGSSPPGSAAWAARSRWPRRWRARRCWRSSASPRASRCRLRPAISTPQANEPRRSAGDDRAARPRRQSRSRSGCSATRRKCCPSWSAAA